MDRRRFLSAYMSCQRGVAAIVFVLAFIPIIMVAGGAMDYANNASATATLQEIVDASVLAGATTKGTDEQRLARAHDYFNANIEEDLGLHGQALRGERASEAASKGSQPYYIQKVDFMFEDEGGALRGIVRAVAPTRIMSMIGIPTTDIVVEAKASAGAEGRQLDMVFCIDATGSMQGTIDSVRNAAFNLEQNINARLTTPFEGMRVRVVFYRDFGADFGTMDTMSPPMTGNSRDLPPAMNRSNGQRFWGLPAQRGTLRSFLDAENANGGEDEPESGFVCLNEAIESDWARVGDRLEGAGSNEKITSVTHMIVLWTDANNRPINDARARGLPRAQPSSYAELKAKWDDPSRMEQANKIFVFFGDLDRNTPLTEEGAGPGVARWRESIGTWGLGRDVFNYSLSDGNDSIAQHISDALSKQKAPPRLTQ